MSYERYWKREGGEGPVWLDEDFVLSELQDAMEAKGVTKDDVSRWLANYAQYRSYKQGEFEQRQRELFDEARKGLVDLGIDLGEMFQAKRNKMEIE